MRTPLRLLSAIAAVGLVAASTASTAQQKPGTPTPAELMEALRIKTTRAVNAPLSKDEMARRELIQRLKAKATRGLSMAELSQPERDELASAVSTAPKVDLEVFFDFNSDKITPTAEPTLRSLGEALKGASADFLVAGHTDAKGRANYNLELSQRRAAAIRDFLVNNYAVPADRLLAVGYGREHLKDPNHPLAAENRRVQIVNMAEGSAKPAQ